VQDDADVYGDELDDDYGDELVVELDEFAGNTGGRDLKATTTHNPQDTSSLEVFESFRTNAESYRGKVEDAITMVTQTDLSRIARLREICKRWKGPLVASVFLTDALFLDKTLKESLMKHCTDMTIVSYKYPGNLERWYPVNKMRNLGIERVQTSHYFMIDIDFLPDEDLKATVNRFLPELNSNRTKTAVVVPAFEYVGKKCDDTASCEKVEPVWSSGTILP
jgi:hypothetical protein